MWGERFGDGCGFGQDVGDAEVEEVDGPGGAEEGDGEVYRRWMEGFTGSGMSASV